ncbi:MAG: DUF885 domain-containing protein, partial [Candidatus Eremiobacteraeota bacterium]|nr:DUF885 domain-containing protein [Candidatus Eremiobacteraeota bacterium]
MAALYVLAAPEVASSAGLTQADAHTTDLTEGWRNRVREAAFRATETLRAAASTEADTRVREDIDILLRAADNVVRGIEVHDAHVVRLIDVARIAFGGLRVLLDEQNPPERKQLALARLRSYAGLDANTPLARAAEAETRARLGVAGLTQPYVQEVRTSLALRPILIDGIGELFWAAGLEGWQDAFDAFREQAEAYAHFVETEVLPRARTDHRLPPDVYSFALHNV